jgi:phosphoenolpyruvate carboxykinase (GTP)
MWPGFGENMRVLKWIVERANGKASAVESPLGWVPTYKDIDWKGLNFTEKQFNELMAVNREALIEGSVNDEKLFLKLHDRFPQQLRAERMAILSRL